MVLLSNYGLIEDSYSPKRIGKEKETREKRQCKLDKRKKTVEENEDISPSEE